MLGSVSIISKTKKLFSVKLDDGNYSVVEFYEPINLNTGDIVLAQYIIGEVFVQNTTKNEMFVAYIHKLDADEKEMRKMIGI